MRIVKRLFIFGLFLVSMIVFGVSNVRAMPSIGTYCWQSADKRIYYNLNLGLDGDIVSVNGYIIVDDPPVLLDLLIPVTGTGVVKGDEVVFSITGFSYAFIYYIGSFTIQLDDLSGQSVFYFERINAIVGSKYIFSESEPIEKITCE